MGTRVRQIVPWMLLAFFVYLIITSPDRTADLVRNVWDVIMMAFRNIARFFNSLISG